MSTTLRAMIMLSLVGTATANAAPPDHVAPLKTIDVPASGRASEIAPVAQPSTDTFLQTATGKLRFRDTSGTWRYCTAQLATYDDTKATLLLTAAHCVRPGYKEYSFKSANENVEVSVDCLARNHQWVDPETVDADQPFDHFINARLDYAFLKVHYEPGASDISDYFEIVWSGSWSDPNPLILANNLSIIGYPAAAGGTLSIIGLGANLQMRPDFYHRKLNSISTSDLDFTSGTSGGAWLNHMNPPQIVSVTSSYIAKTSNTGVGNYLTVYGPILHEDAKNLAEFTESSSTTGGGECQ